jgi:hypothetical protein
MGAIHAHGARLHDEQLESNVLTSSRLLRETLRPDGLALSPPRTPRDFSLPVFLLTYLSHHVGSATMDRSADVQDGRRWKTNGRVSAFQCFSSVSARSAQSAVKLFASFASSARNPTAGWSRAKPAKNAKAFQHVVSFFCLTANCADQTDWNSAVSARSAPSAVR